MSLKILGNSGCTAVCAVLERSNVSGRPTCVCCSCKGLFNRRACAHADAEKEGGRDLSNSSQKG